MPGFMFVGFELPLPPPPPPPRAGKPTSRPLASSSSAERRELLPPPPLDLEGELLDPLPPPREEDDAPVRGLLPRAEASMAAISSSISMVVLRFVVV
jgi:hypothetical protein